MSVSEHGIFFTIDNINNKFTIKVVWNGIEYPINHVLVFCSYLLLLLSSICTASPTNRVYIMIITTLPPSSLTFSTCQSTNLLYISIHNTMHNTHTTNTYLS